MRIAKGTGFELTVTADLQKWRAFVAIGELGSLTRAALFLDSNQSLLSRQLNALERECGARLFNRTGRGVELSEVGARLFPQVKALLADAQQLEGEIRGEAREPTGRVTSVRCPRSRNPLVGRLFTEMRDRHPGGQPEGARRVERPGRGMARRRARRHRHPLPLRPDAARDGAVAGRRRQLPDRPAAATG